MSKPRPYLLPREYPPDKYRNVLMSGGILPNGGGSAPQMGLYNNSVAGRYLFVYGLEIFSLGPTADWIFSFSQKGHIASSSPGTAAPLKFDEAPSAGTTEVYLAFGGSAPPILQVLGTVIGWWSWPYQFPVAIIPPGYLFGLQFAGSPTQVGATFQWYEGEPIDEHAQLVEQV